MENDLISVIIPVYNMEKYIKRCLDSVINQTYKNIQIIVINDDSTDNSKKICEEYAKLDSRITFLTKENEGVSEVRNMGLTLAKGKYVYFIDSDDYVEHNIIERLYSNLISYKADLSICGFYEKTLDNILPMTKGEVQVLNKEEGVTNLLKVDSYRGYLWNKLFLLETVKKNKLKFNKEIAIWEDVLFVFRYMMNSTKIIYDPTPLYIYVHREDSAVHDSTFNKNMYSEVIAKEIIEKELPESYKEAKNFLYRRFIEGDLSIIRKISLDDRVENMNYFYSAINNMKKYYKKVFNSLSINDKISIILILLNPIFLAR